MIQVKGLAGPCLFLAASIKLTHLEEEGRWLFLISEDEAVCSIVYRSWLARIRLCTGSAT